MELSATVGEFSQEAALTSCEGIDGRDVVLGFEVR
jgi:hypothetical protein